MATLKGAIPLPKSKNSDYQTLDDERTPIELDLGLDKESRRTAGGNGQPVVDDEVDDLVGVNGNEEEARTTRDKGKGRAREDDDHDHLHHPQPQSHSNSYSSSQPQSQPRHPGTARRNPTLNSSLDGDLSVNTSSSSSNEGMYLSPTTAESRPPSTTSPSTRSNTNLNTNTNTNTTSTTTTSNRYRSKTTTRDKDPRWDLDTMETPRLDAHPGSLSYSKSIGGRSRSPLVDEYTEPRWNHKSVGDTGRRDHGADDRSRFPIGEAAEVDAEVGIGGILAGLGSGDYPMQNEEQEEEKRIQDNLASLAAKEAARRRAARSSKAFVTRPSGGLSYTPYETDAPGLSMSSSGSSGAVGSNGRFARRASGWLGGLTGAVPGFGRLGGVQEDHEDMAGRRRTRLAHSDSPSSSNTVYGEPIPQSPVPSPIPGPSSISRGPSPIPRPPSTNPFESELDHRVSHYDPASEYPSRSSPTRTQQPGIDLEPRARGNAEAGPSRSAESSTSSSRSTVLQQQQQQQQEQQQQKQRQPDLQLDCTVSSASTLTNDGYVRMEDSGWKGPTWRGGAGAKRLSGSPIHSPTTFNIHDSPTTTLDLDSSRYGYPTSSIGMGASSDQVFSRIGPTPRTRPRMAPQREVRRDKWWYALCSWGSELDDGEDGQGGRTNPFE